MTFKLEEKTDYQAIFIDDTKVIIPNVEELKTTDVVLTLLADAPVILQTKYCKYIGPTPTQMTEEEFKSVIIQGKESETKTKAEEKENK